MSKSTLKLLEDTEKLIDFKKLTIGPLIGRGNFSSVYVGKYMDSLVAVKKQERSNEVPDKYLLQELSILNRLRVTPHSNIIIYFGAHDEVSTNGGLHAMYIVLQYCQGGDLLQLIIDHSKFLSWKFRIQLACQAMSAIVHIHKQNILHRDIKSSNILLDENWVCKLSDFGAARAVLDLYSPTKGKPKKQAMTICGTDSYAAPEMLFQEDYCAAVDIFSLGMVLYELLKRHKVGVGGFLERKPQNKFEINVEATVAQLPEDAPQSLVLLAQQCTLFEYDQRPSGIEVFEWLQDLYNGMPEDPTPNPPMRSVPENFGGESDAVSTPNSTLARASIYGQDDENDVNLQRCGDVSLWLYKLGLPEYVSIFAEKGYRYEMLCMMGLKEEDMTYLGITHPSHRSLLVRSIRPHYSKTVQIHVVSHYVYDTVTVYLVASRFGFSHSSIELRYTDFVLFDRSLRKEMSNEEELLSKLPTFMENGSFQKGFDILSSQKNLAMKRHEAFERYLNLLAYILKGTAYQPILLEFLSLKSRDMIEKKGNKILTFRG